MREGPYDNLGNDPNQYKKEIIMNDNKIEVIDQWKSCYTHLHLCLEKRIFDNNTTFPIKEDLATYNICWW